MTTEPQAASDVRVKPRIGAMTREEFRLIGSTALGGRGWQRALAHATGWAPSTITRYLQGVLPIPQHAALLMRLVADRHDAGIPMRHDFLYEEVRDGS